MNRGWLEKALAYAERHVVIGEQHIADLRHYIDRLSRDGRNAGHATEVLNTFELTHATRVRHRDRLLAEINCVSDSE
jgi:hypothetical protein